MLRRLPRPGIGPGASAPPARDRHKGGLARRLVLARRLAELLGSALYVQKVVDDLKGKPKIVGVARQRRAQGLARLAQNSTRHPRKVNKRAGLQSLPWGEGAD